MHLSFFKRSFAVSLMVPCVLLLTLALLQSGLLHVFSVGIVSQDALVAGAVQSCLLILLMPWVLFLRYQEFWSTRSFSSEEMREMIWKLYLKFCGGLVCCSLGLYVILRVFSVYFSGFSPLWIMCFAALSLYGALGCAQNLMPDKRQWIYGFGIVILAGFLGRLFPTWGNTIACLGLMLLCFGTWLLWRIFPVSDRVFSADTDLSALLFYPLFSGGNGLPKTWRRFAFMSSSTYLSLLVLLCGLLPLTLIFWSVFWLGNQWGQSFSLHQDFLEPVYPWVLVALFLTQVQSAYFWQGRREFWLTRPISYWQIQGLSVGVHFALYFLTVFLGVLLCQAYTGYTFQGGFYASIVFFFLLGPALAFITLLQMGLGLGGIVGVTYLLTRGDSLSYILWGIALAGWIFMATRSHYRTSTQWKLGLGVAVAIHAVLFYGFQHSPVLRAVDPTQETNSWDYGQQSRIETYLTHLLWLNVPRHESPFAVAQAVLLLDTQPETAVDTLMKDTLAMLQKTDILEVSPEAFLQLWDGDRDAAGRRLKYWREFAPQSKQWLAFEYALQGKSAQALAEAQRAYEEAPDLQRGLQWAYLQRVFLQEEQALRHYQDLQQRFPEARDQLLLQQGQLLARGCEPALAQKLYQQVNKANALLSLQDLKQIRLSGHDWSCLEKQPTLAELLESQYLKRSLKNWTQLNAESQLYMARDTLFDAHNSPEVLAFFKLLLRAEDFSALQATSKEIQDLWVWAESHGVMNAKSRRTYSLFPAIFKGELLTAEERQHYPHLLAALGKY